ncbi:MAG: hypothetical protein RR057_04560, partial [Clostridia bacterium]
ESTLQTFLTPTFGKEIKSALIEKVKAELGAEATADEIAARVEELNTNEYKIEQVKLKYTPEQIETEKNKLIKNSIDAKIREEQSKIVDNPQYQSDVNVSINSAECHAEIQAAIAAENYDLFQEKYDELILAAIKEYAVTLHESFSTEIKTKYDAFVKDILQKFDFNNEKTKSKAMYEAALDALITKDLETKIMNTAIDEAKKVMPPDSKMEDIKEKAKELMTPTFMHTEVI